MEKAASSSLEVDLTSKYDLLEHIGQGASAKVHLARHILTGTQVAVKVLRKNEEDLAFITSETSIMKALEHPNVVQLFDVIETTGSVYLVMEYAAGGQLLQHIPEAGMQEEEARKLFRQVASALCYCHRRGVVHRDVKAENILLDAQGNVKLGDFGLGRLFSPGEMLSTICGTPVYWAPELYLMEEYDGPAADTWSLGVLLYLMLVGRVPFDGTNAGRLMEQVLQCRCDYPAHVPAAAQDLIREMLTVDPSERPHLEEIMCHPWVSQGEPASVSLSSEPLSPYPDPSTVMLMLDLGYDLTDTWSSLMARCFDDTMATYRMLHHQKTQGADLTVHRRSGFSGLAPWASSSDPHSLTLLRNRSASEPTLSSIPFWPSEHQLPEGPRQQGQKGSRRASLPEITSSSLQARSRRSPRAGATPESSVPTEQPPGGTAGSARDRGWRRVTRRIMACINTMCCCVVAPRTGSRRTNTGAKETAGRTKKVAPEPPGRTNTVAPATPGRPNTGAPQTPGRPNTGAPTRAGRPRRWQSNRVAPARADHPGPR